VETELMETVIEIIQSYSDESNLKSLLEFWKRIENVSNDDCLKSFLMGSVYGQCLFLFKSYYKKECLNRKRDFEELISTLLKRLECKLSNIKQV
jgi:hypothetical protein